MKIGVSYSLFDGEELLPRSVEVMRDCGADYINVIWQAVSYFGSGVSLEVRPILDGLVSRGLVDEIYLYVPKYSGYPAFSKYAARNAKKDENAKRNIGLRLARQAGCTHFMTMDVDEFYLPAEFKRAAEHIDANSIDLSAVSIITYVVKPTLRRKGDPSGGFRVPFLCNIRDHPDVALVYKSKNYPGISIDPTRGVGLSASQHRFHVFPPAQICMHHMSTVRRDLWRKLCNTSSLGLATIGQKKGMIDKILKDVVDPHEVIETENLFGIDIAASLDTSLQTPPQMHGRCAWLVRWMYELRAVLTDRIVPLSRRAY